MTRECAWCGKTLGEKCPLCGEENDLETTGTLFNKPVSFRCHGCGATFTRGAGGTTHGVCEPCKQAIERIGGRARLLR